MEPGGAGPLPDPFGVTDANPHACSHPHAGPDADDPASERDAAALPDAHQEALTPVAEGPRISAVVACVDDAGRVLIVKQTAGPFAGTWLLPGGNVERNESLEDAARRELFEETGYRAGDLRPVARYEVRSVPAGRFHFLVHLFRAGPLEETPKAEAGGGLRWAEPGEIDPHPNLALTLVDLELIQRDRATVVRDLAAVGIEMQRVF